MTALPEFINEALPYAPFFISFALILNSVGLPISEDALIIAAGVLASTFPPHSTALYLGCLSGAYFGDMGSYWLWRLLGGILLEKPFWKKRIKTESMERYRKYFDKYGAAVLIAGRFIPFGVRVLICLYAGMSKYNYRRFAFFDLLAALASTGTIFTLSYFLGDAVKKNLDQAKWILFALAILLGLVLYLHRKAQKKNKQTTPM